MLMRRTERWPSSEVEMSRSVLMGVVVGRKVGCLFVRGFFLSIIMGVDRLFLGFVDFLGFGVVFNLRTVVILLTLVVHYIM